MTSPVHLVRPALLSDVAEYAYLAYADADRTLVHLAGSCPLDADGNTIGIGDVRAQAAACVANLATALASCGGSTADVVQTRVLVATTAHSELVAAWEAYRDAIAPHDPPSTLVGVTVLGYSGQLVEVEAVAAVPTAALVAP